MMRWIFLPVTLLLLLNLSIPAAVLHDLQVVDSFARMAATKPFATPRWHNGYLVSFSTDFPPEIRLLDSRTGNIVRTKSIAFSMAPYVRILNVTVSNTGRIAYSGIARDDQGRGVLVIGWVSASGEPEFVVRSEKFAAEHLSFGPNGTLWVRGRTNKVDLLAHFDASGRQITPYIEFPRGAGGVLSNFHPQPLSMIAISEKVGILRDGKDVWTEISNDGHTLGEWPLPPKTPRGITGIAFTPAGDVYVSMDQAQDPKGAADVRLLKLRKDTGQWTEIPYDVLRAPDTPSAPRRYIHLVGARGEDLVIDIGQMNDIRVVRLTGN
jgi:hypothetical protein